MVGTDAMSAVSAASPFVLINPYATAVLYINQESA